MPTLDEKHNGAQRAVYNRAVDLAMEIAQFPGMPIASIMGPGFLKHRQPVLATVALRRRMIEAIAKSMTVPL